MLICKSLQDKSLHDISLQLIILPDISLEQLISVAIILLILVKELQFILLEDISSITLIKLHVISLQLIILQDISLAQLISCVFIRLKLVSASKQYNSERLPSLCSEK